LADAARSARWFISFPPIYAIAIAVVAGDGLGNCGIFIPLWLAGAMGLAAAALFLRAHRDAGVAIALAAIVVAATVPVHRMLAPVADPLGLRRFGAGAMLTVHGRLVREAERFPDKMRLYVAVKRAGKGTNASAPAHGVIRVTVLSPGPFRVGDEVRFRGRIHFPRNFGDPGEFDYEGFMARNGIAATMLAVAPRGGGPAVAILARHHEFPASEIEWLRGRIAGFIDRNLDDPVASEMRALVIGDRGGISREMHETFGRTGMAHLLVISGLHLSMVAAAVFVVVRFMLLLFPAVAGRGWANRGAALAAMVAVSAYAIIAGHHVSTIRALVMVLAYMFAVAIGRPREALASLALAAIVICVGLPGSSADVGFELSFASVLAIVLGMRRYAAWVERRRLERGFAGITPSHAEIAWEWTLGYVAVSFWAMLAVAPLTAFYFNQFSLVGLVANAVTVPIMGFGGTVLGLAASALSFVWGQPAGAMLRVAGRFIAAGNLMAEWFVNWPLAWTRVFTPTPVEIALAYSVLLVWLTWPVRWRSGRSTNSSAAEGAGRGRWRYAALAALVGAITVDAGWWTHQRYFSPDLRVTFLAVGEGDAAVVRFPGARVMLVDAGGGWRDFDMGERIVARYLWSRKIMHVDWLALSHPDRDHFGGFEFIARNFSPRAFWTNGGSSRDESYSELLATLYALNISIRVVDARLAPMHIGAVTVAALNPPARAGTSHNNNSMVLRLQFGATSFLFTGDLEAAGEQTLIRSGRRLDALVLKVPHHGSRTSSSAQFIEAVRPEAAVISLGYHNRFHFPAAEVIGRYRGEGAWVLRTDHDGAVIVDATADGATLRAYRSDVTFRLESPPTSGRPR
jgi:competence protein ComEC